jgi:hypothetical protein
MWDFLCYKRTVDVQGDERLTLSWTECTMKGGLNE